MSSYILFQWGIISVPKKQPGIPKLLCRFIDYLDHPFKRMSLSQAASRVTLLIIVFEILDKEHWEKYGVSVTCMDNNGKALLLISMAS
jgi:hypothetical protein